MWLHCTEGGVDYVVDSCGLRRGTDLETSAINLLHINARADTTINRKNSDDRRGYWGAKYGSKLWTITDSSAQSVLKAKQYAATSLQPLIQQGIASEIDVQVSLTSSRSIQIDVTIHQPDKIDPIQLAGQADAARTYEWIWNAKTVN